MNNDNRNDTLIAEMLQSLILEKEKAFPKILETLLNEAMLVDRENHLCASPYERAEERNGYANGFKTRHLQTLAGKLELRVPQVRNSQTPFYPTCLERGLRTDRAIYLAAAEMYVQGVSTRRVETVFRQMGIENFSAEQVSRAAQLLDEEIAKWRTRRIDKAVKVIFLDATYQNVRINGVGTYLATFIVTGIFEDGHRAILAVDSDSSEAEIHWRKVLRDLKERGLYGLNLIVSDAHEGLASARKAVFAGVPWQRCQMHLQQNAQAKITKASLKKTVASDIRAIFNAPSLEEAKRLLDLAIKKYTTEEKQPKLVAWMEQNIPEGFTVFAFPEHLRKKLRTNNIEERLNKAIKARTKLINIFPNQQSQLRLVSAICMEISEAWETGNIYLNVNNL